MNDCLFCKIIAHEIPSAPVYEDEHTYAFLDIHPINRGHTLVVPKLHADDMFEASEESFLHVMKTAHNLAPKVMNAVGAEGVNIGINTHPAAGQIVFHLHVHIIPRFTGDGHAHWHGNPYQDGEISTMQSIIAEAFK
jgi:histidine triad (HIT) family protein